MFKCMIMSCCWEYVCVRLDKMHEKDWIKWGNYVSAMKSKTINDSKVANDYWIGSDMDCGDDLWVDIDSVFINDFYINSGTCALMNYVSAANQIPLLNCVVSSESVFYAKLWCRQWITFRCWIVVPTVNRFRCWIVVPTVNQFSCWIMVLAAK